MSEQTGSDEEAEVFIVEAYGAAQLALKSFREKGTIIADFRSVDEADRQRVADFLAGASLAHGNSPYRLANQVYFISKGRHPSPAEIARYPSDPEPPQPRP